MQAISKANAKSILSLLKQTWADFSEDKAMRLAAALSAYTILSLAPMLVILIKILAVALRPERARAIVESQMDQLIGPAGADAIGAMVENATKPGTGILATVVSVLILLWSASNVFAELQDSLNTIWEVKLKPNLSWWRTIVKRFFSMSMIFVIAFLLLVSMFVTATLGLFVNKVVGADPPERGEKQKTAAVERTEGAAAQGGAAPQEQQQEEKKKQGIIGKVVGYLLDFVVTTLVVWGLFTMIFKLLPDVKMSWRDVWLGALVTAILFKIGQYALTAYFYFGSATSAYGAFGSMVAVLLWAYYSSVILFFGAEFTQVYVSSQGRVIEPDGDAVRVTEEERAQQGIPDPDRVAAKAEGRAPARPAGAAAFATASAGPQRRQEVVAGSPPIHYQVVGGGGAARPGRPPASGLNGGSAEVGVKDYLFAAGGLALGALGAWYYTTRTGKPTARQAAAVRLDERLKQVEEKVGRVSRLRQLLEDVEVHNRIKDVQRQLRHARSVVRSKENHRPAWLVRLGDKVAGNE